MYTLIFFMTEIIETTFTSKTLSKETNKESVLCGY